MHGKCMSHVLMANDKSFTLVIILEMCLISENLKFCRCMRGNRVPK
jgi:hypothetical protein